jgi:hypothetical protein
VLKDNEDGTVQKSGPGLEWRFDNLTVFFVHLALAMTLRTNAFWNFAFRSLHPARGGLSSSTPPS